MKTNTTAAVTIEAPAFSSVSQPEPMPATPLRKTASLAIVGLGYVGLPLAIQFARSTPGVGTALAGLSTPAHLEDMLAVARTPPLANKDYARLFRRAE